MMYEEGNLVEQDKEKAKELLKKAGFWNKNLKV
jgi:TPR repeat protein